MHRELDQAGDIVNIELLHQARTIGVDGLRTKFETGANLLGTQALDQQVKYLELAGAKTLERIGGSRLVGGKKDLLQIELRRDVDAAIQHLIETVEQVLRRPRFQNKGFGSAAECLKNGLPVAARREHGHPDGQSSRFDLTDDLQGMQ